MKLSSFPKKLGATRFSKGAKSIYRWILVICGALIVVAMIAMVISRYVLHTNLYGFDEVILSFVLWYYFMGALNGSEEDSQIRADVANTLIKNQNAKWCVAIVARVIETVVCAFLLYLSFDLIKINLVRMPTTTGLKIPLVVLQSAILVGFAGMLVYTVGYLISELGNPPWKNENMENDG